MYVCSSLYPVHLPGGCQLSRSIHVRCAVQTCWIPSSTDVQDRSEASVLNLGIAIHGLDQLIALTVAQVRMQKLIH